jgi:hypothetical protein
LDGVSIATDAAKAIEIKGFGAAANATVITKVAATGLLGYQANLVDGGYANVLHKHKNTDYVNEIHVAPTASEGDYQTIAAAIAAASPSATSRVAIIVHPGYYGITSGMTIPQYVSILGIARNACKVYVSGAGAAIDMFTLGSDCTIENLSLTARYNTYNDACIVAPTAGAVTNTRIRNCWLQTGRYGVCYGSQDHSNILVESCEMVDCSLPIYLSGNISGIIRGGRLVRNTIGVTGITILGLTTSQLGISDFSITGANGQLFSTAGIQTDNVTGVDIANVLVNYAATGFYSNDAADVLVLKNCSTTNCTVDLRTNVVAGRILLDGGLFTAANITDAGLGTPSSKGITGGYTDRASHAFTTR